MAKEGKERGFLSWLACVLGWLVCAAFCLAAFIGLEAYPAAYDIFFPAILLVLFCNIFLFLFVATRWSGNWGRLLGSIIRVCAGEGLLMAGIYALGR